MNSFERTQQLAVLLNLVGDDAAGQAMQSLDQETAKELNKVLSDFKNDPPTASEINLVMEDFERFFSFALEHIEDELSDAASPTNSKSTPEKEVEEETFDVAFESVKTFTQPNLTGDTKLDLNMMHPYQVAYAIRNDNPSAIAVVINCLADAHAGKTLECLPPDVRLQVFLQMASPTNVSKKVEQQILSAALTSSLKVETRVPEEDRTGQMVALTRSLPKKIRGPLLEQLMEQNKELAESVKSEMYQFDDLGRLEDREIQKVLAQSDSDSLVLALVNAEPELKEKLLGNMSKRARQTIEDELEYKTNAKAEEIEAGQKKVVEIIVRMDEEGEISLE